MSFYGSFLWAFRIILAQPTECHRDPGHAEATQTSCLVLYISLAGQDLLSIRLQCRSGHCQGGQLQLPLIIHQTNCHNRAQSPSKLLQTSPIMILPLGSAFSPCLRFFGHRRDSCSPCRTTAKSSSYLPVMMEQRPSSSHPIASVSPPLSPSPTSPISRLPVELLTQIFTHVPRMEFEESLHWQATQTTPLLPQPTWIAIAQVCQHWRAVATNCKDFWSYIPLQTSPHCVEKSLARSYPRPISFSIDFSPTPRPEWYRNSVLSVLRSLSRARQVHFRGSPNTELWKEASRLLNPVPEVSESGASVQDHVPQDSDSVALPGDISLRCDPTALRSLTLTLCDIYPSSPLFRAPLLSLRLVDCRVEFPLKILALLPQLRTLVLQNTRDTRISSDVLHSALPQLQHLELTNVSSVIAFLLRGIIVPSSSSLSITCTDYTDIEEPLDDVSLLNTVTSNISPALSTHLEGALREGYKYPLLEIASTTSTAKKTLVLLDPAPHAGEHRLQFSLVWADSPESINLFSQMLFMFPSAVRQGIRTLRMREAPILHTANVRSHPLPSTFHDKVRDEAVRGLLAFVMGQGLLPALCQIALESVDLKNPDVDMLVRVLVDRQRSSTVPGEGKISLSLQNCLIDLDSIRSLRDRLGLDAVDIT